MPRRKHWVGAGKNEPRYPLFVVSKGRADSRLTSRALDRMGVLYRMIVEEQEVEEYAAAVGRERLLVLPDQYKDDYDLFDDLGRSKSTGPGPARNFAWDTALSEGHSRHWVMDDNIRQFCRKNRNRINEVLSGAAFRAMEDFCDRYENVAMAGPNYEMFVPRRNDSKAYPPFKKNTRIYSCNLILNEAPYRWRGRYNEDTDLSLRMLKGKWCTIQFNAFMQMKVRTQVLKGGCTGEFYAKEGTYPKSEILVRMHPDVASLVWRFGRVHHHVDYAPFKRTALVRKPGTKARDTGSSEYGMELHDRA